MRPYRDLVLRDRAGLRHWRRVGNYSHKNGYAWVPECQIAADGSSYAGGEYCTPERRGDLRRLTCLRCLVLLKTEVG